MKYCTDSEKGKNNKGTKEREERKEEINK